MQRSLTLKHHADLVDRMAQAQDIDIEAKMMEGLISPEDLNAAVLACTGCARPGDCAHWLATHDEGAATPDYCRNTGLFADLLAGRHV